MRIVRLSIIILTAAGLAACATGPTSAPPAASSGNFADTLHLCPGNHISNAPATDRKKHILGYDPFADISGVMVARAPVKGCLSSGYGRRHGRSGTHQGIDLYTGSARSVLAADSGVIEEMRTIRGYGNTILIRHNSRVKTRYAHLSSYARGLRAGDRVQRGDHIGRTGKTGNATAVHLHYEIIVNGTPRNPLTVGD